MTYRLGAVPTLGRLNATPIKGTSLDHPDAVELTPLGNPWNRRFHLVDDRGRLFTAADSGALMRVRARVGPEGSRLALTLPDGSTVSGPTDRPGAARVTDFYGRPVAGHEVPGPFDAALSEVVGRRVRLIRVDVDGDGSDVHRLSLLSWSSVRSLGARSGRPDLDPRRFRMDLELDGCAPFEEDSWAGRTVRVGAAILAILGPIPRCVVTTLDPATGAKDFDTLKRIAEARPLMTDPRGVPFGMYAEVVEPGRIAVGDPVELLDDRPTGGPEASGS